jgi:hypothetical protein
VDRDRDSARERVAVHVEAAVNPVRLVATRLAAFVLVLAIFAGTLMLWIGIPLASLWVVSRVAKDALTTLMIVLIVCPLAMLVFAQLLFRLNDLHLRVTGAPPLTSRTAWLKSISGERVQRRASRSVLEVCMLISVGLAFAAMLVWFFFFAHSPTPGFPF